MSEIFDKTPFPNNLQLNKEWKIIFMIKKKSYYLKLYYPNYIGDSF